MSVVSKGFNSLCFGAVAVLVSCGPLKLPGGEWKVAVGEVDTLRLWDIALASRVGEGISCASVMIKS
jgi:hypothetical protein